MEITETWFFESETQPSPATKGWVLNTPNKMKKTLFQY